MFLAENNKIVNLYIESLEQNIITYDFRYSDTLRMNFNFVAGLGSYGDIEDINQIEEFQQYNPQELEKYLKITEYINNIIHESFIKYEPVIDWRDDQEVEIHFQNEYDSVPGDNEIQQCIMKIKEIVNTIK